MSTFYLKSKPLGNQAHEAKKIKSLIKEGERIRGMNSLSNLKRFEIANMMGIPDAVTILNLICGLLCIFQSIQQHFAIAATLLVCALVCDYFDGKIAKLLQRKTAFGREIDSLADLVSFGVAPGVFGLMYLDPSKNYLHILLPTIGFFVVCGLIRLARYNIMHYEQGFMGMPITVNGIIFPLIYAINTPAVLWPIIYVVLAILMVSPFKIRRML